MDCNYKTQNTRAEQLKQLSFSNSKVFVQLLFITKTLKDYGLLQGRDRAGEGRWRNVLRAAHC